MKLATLNNGKRDGAPGGGEPRSGARRPRDDHCPRPCSRPLDEWAKWRHNWRRFISDSNEGACPDAFPFDETACPLPLPRAYQWIDGAYVNHVELVRKRAAPTCQKASGTILMCIREALTASCRPWPHRDGLRGVGVSTSSRKSPSSPTTCP